MKAQEVGRGRTWLCGGFPWYNDRNGPDFRQCVVSVWRLYSAELHFALVVFPQPEISNSSLFVMIFAFFLSLIRVADVDSAGDSSRL